MSEAPTTAARYSSNGFFVLRSPLLPFSDFLDWARASADDQDPAAHVQAVRERLRAMVERPEVRQALFVASPSLQDSIEYWSKSPTDRRGAKIERALVKYVERMSTRPTPFGLFAGCSVGSIGDHTALELAPQRSNATHSRLDMDYLYALAEDLNRDPAVRERLRYVSNSSLYQVAGRLRLVEARVVGRVRTHHLVAIEPTGYLMGTLERARSGARLCELAEGLVADQGGEVTLEEAREYVTELVDAQVLVSELAPAVSGREPIHGLIDVLAARGTDPALARTLAAARDRLADIDTSGLGTPTAAYEAVAAGLEALPTTVERARLIQVDMVKPVTALTLSQALIDEVTDAVELLAALSPPPEDALASFREAFKFRYEQREIPLVQALDQECGLDFDRGSDSSESPLLAGLAFARGAARGGAREPTGPADGLLAQLLYDAARDGPHEVVLTDGHIRALRRTNNLTLPRALSVFFTLEADSAAAVDRGEHKIWLQHAAGPSGARMLGRFCHADPELDRFTREHLRAEETGAQDAVFAEIVHLAQGRVGNIVCRPVLRDYEIVYLAKSEAPEDRQLPITDLLVSVRGDRIVLRSRRLGKEIIPRQTSAHNALFPANLRLYRFLNLLQGQGHQPGVVWRWTGVGSPPFLPRVSRGRVVLSPARWRLDRELLQRLAKDDDQAAITRIRSWAEIWRVPRVVALADADNELPVDFENPLSLLAFVRLVDDRSSCELVEIPYRPEQLCLRSPEGPFSHEILIPLIRARELRPPPQRGPAPLLGVPLRERVFAPASEWLFVKVYAGASTIDRVLTHAVMPVLDRLRGDPGWKCWFFVRFGDPDWHLRLRLLGQPSFLFGTVLPALHAALQPLVADESVWKLQLDTYVREIERYGGPVGMALSEQVFAVDSEAVLGIVATFDGEDSGDARWQIALRGLDLLLDDFGLDLQRKLDLMQRCRADYAAEFQADKTGLAQALGRRFRSCRKPLEEMMRLGPDDHSSFQPALRMFACRSQALEPTVAALGECERAGRLWTPVARLVQSYLHMFVNRLIRADARQHEVVLYDFLARHYESAIARSKHAGKSARNGAPKG